MDQWITYKNILYFEDKLRREADPAKKEVLRTLLRDEQVRLRSRTTKPAQPLSSRRSTALIRWP